MSPTLQITVQIISIVLGASASFTCAIVLWSLKNLRDSIDKSDHRIEMVEQENKHRLELVEAETRKLSDRKQECQRDFISTAQFVRETGYTRSRLDETVEGLRELSAKFDFAARLPEICSKIAAETVKEMANIYRINKG